VEKTLKKIIETTLKKVDLYSPEAADLIFETGKAESGYYALEQMGNGPAKGYFQCEPATMYDCVDNYIKFRPSLENAMYGLGYDEEDPEFSLLTNIALQVFFCRIKYRRDKDPIPKTTRGRADYWKKVYNTEKGKGTVEHYMKANNPF
jgi:type VI secretion system secreted protein VgrG